MTPIRRAEILSARLRSVAEHPKPDLVVVENACPLAVPRQMAQPLVGWVLAHVAGMLDDKRRISISSLSWSPGAGQLEASFDGPWVVLNPTRVRVDRHLSSIEHNLRGDVMRARLRISRAVASRLGAVAGSLLVVFADENRHRLLVSTPAVLAAHTLVESGQVR